MSIKAVDFSGVIYQESGGTSTSKVPNDCSLKCELEINDIDNINISKVDAKTGHFKINSSLFTIKYGTKVHNFSNNNENFVSNEVIHKGLYPSGQNYGIITELVLKANDINNNELHIFIPIYKGKRDNNNGIILKNILTNNSGSYDIGAFFPRDTTYYNFYYQENNKRKKSVIFTGSNIKLTQETFQSISCNVNHMPNYFKSNNGEGY